MRKTKNTTPTTVINLSQIPHKFLTNLSHSQIHQKSSSETSSLTLFIFCSSFTAIDLQNQNTLGRSKAVSKQKELTPSQQISVERL